jgi:hypothetical protein
MQVIRNLLIAMLAATLMGSAFAQVQQARGKATIAYKGKSVPADAKAAALQNAQLKALETYYAEAGDSESANFDALRPKVVENPDRYFLDTTILAEDDNAGSQQYTVTVRVALNVPNLRNDIKAGSAVGKAARTQRSSLAFLFVSREVETTTSYDDRVSKRADVSISGNDASQAAQKGTEGERIRRGQISTNASTSQSSSYSSNASATVETGGKRVRRSDDASYRLFPSQNLNQVFTQTFSGAGFKVNEASMVEPYTGGNFKVSQVEDDYRSGMDLKAGTMQSIAVGMRTAQIPYIALGTLDAAQATTDPASGLPRVDVTVNARVFDVTQPIPDTIASVGPVSYGAVGPSPDAARTAALKLAATSAARELTSQLTTLGLK